MKLRLFRGLTLLESEVDDVIMDIKNNGLYYTDKMLWKVFYPKNLKNNIEELFENHNLTEKETRDLSTEIQAICFADIYGAQYYAKKHNTTKDKQMPILIEIEADIENVVIDGRDFLYTCFGMLKNNEEPIIQAEQKRKIEMLYGNSILRYLDKCGNSTNPQYRIALCDLAVQDNNVILDHYNNLLLMQGKYNTIFRSAFMVIVPIPREQIVSIQKLDNTNFDMIPDIKLDDIIFR